MDGFSYSYPFKEPATALSLRGNSLPAGSQGEMTYNFEYLSRYFRFSKYGMSILTWFCLQL
jgi:hypothetical protein